METLFNILELVAMIAAGAATAIPLISKLIKVIDELRRSRNWSRVLAIVTDLMCEAEEMAASGADKKAFVLAGVETLAESIDHDIDMNALSDLIDNLCEMSKKVNIGGV